jgi:RNA polymerase primary sigma factor
VSENLITKYLYDVGKLEVPILSKEEEAILITKAKDGYIVARNKLISSHIKMIFKVAFGYRNYPIPVTDLIDEGILGFIRAIDSYEVDRKLKFFSYAIWWVRAYILRAITDQSISIYQEKDELSPIIKEVNKNLKGENKPKINIKNNQNISLNSTYSSLKEEKTLLDLIINESSSNPEKEIVKKIIEKLIVKFLSSLPELERKVLEHTFRIGDIGKYTLNELSDKFGISKTSIRQIKKQAIDRIKNMDDFQQYKEEYENYLDAS